MARAKSIDQVKMPEGVGRQRRKAMTAIDVFNLLLSILVSAGFVLVVAAIFRAATRRRTVASRIADLPEFLKDLETRRQSFRTASIGDVVVLFPSGITAEQEARRIAQGWLMLDVGRLVAETCMPFLHTAGRISDVHAYEAGMRPSCPLCLALDKWNARRVATGG